MFKKFLVILLFAVILDFNDAFSAPHYEMGDSNISTDTNWQEGEYSMNNLTVRNGATLTIEGGSTISVTGTLHIEGNSKVVLKSKDAFHQIDGQWQGSGVTINAANITIDTGSKISADGQGYVGGAGPGAGKPDTYMKAGSGGGYGGQGGNSGAGGVGGLVYGSSIIPTDLGSGGGAAGGISVGGNGGGSIRLNVSGVLTLDGEISADGAVGTSTPCGVGAGAGGAGGSILVTVDTLTGSGLFTANGGVGGVGGCYGSYSASDDGGGGGGGRIAVYYAVEESYDGFGTSSANGGAGANAGMRGTVAFINTTENLLQIFSQTFTYEEDSSISFNAITIDNGGLLIIGGGSTINVLNSVTVEGNSTIILQSKDTAGQVNGQWQGSGVTINAGNITIESGSKISADGHGYKGGAGPGVGSPDTYMHAGSGGGYGGQGGNSGAGGVGGLVYGSSIMPTDLGSGGGAAGGISIGGNGGGSIRLDVSGTLTLNGVISADGTSGTNTPCGLGAGGGGSGGSILVTVGTLTGNGSFTANGGTGGVGGCYGSYSASDDGGGGGGGRIAIFYWNVVSLPTGNITANGGPGANAGSPGTIVIQKTPPGSPSSLISIPDIWTDVNSFSVTWNNPTDFSGIVAARYKIGSPPTSNNDGTQVLGNDIQRLDNLVVPNQGETLLYVWLEDVFGNKDYLNRAQVTLRFDGSPPVATGTFSISYGAQNTNSSLVTLNNLGAADLLSGLTQMRFSNNPDGPWSSPEPFSSNKTDWDLSQYGGNGNAGPKTVYVQYGDAAGNWSNSFSSSIYYQPIQAFPFIDDFSADKGWFGSEPGGWERGPAVSGVSENRNPDPQVDYPLSGDNYILGFAIGADYLNNITEEKSIISPPINCTGQDQVFLKFRRYLNVESSQPEPNVEGDHARIYVSTNGTDWIQVWENPPIDTTDSRWVPFVLDISDMAANQATVYIKFTMGPTNSSRQFSGWNIDDFEVTSEAIYPSEGTMGTELEITGSNFGAEKGKVFIGSTALKVLEWNNEFIQAVLTKPMDPGVDNVTIQPSGPKGTPSIIENDGFAAKAAEIYSVHQTEGSAYDQVTITGKFFGTKKGAVYLECDSNGESLRKTCKIVGGSWLMNPVTGDSEVTFIVPKMSPALCDVVVDPYGTIIPPTPDNEAFTVEPPKIEKVEPDSGVAGKEITISGRFFGTKKGKVYLGYEVNGMPKKKSCSIISWGEDEIIFVVPNLPNGFYDVIVTNSVGLDTAVGAFNIK